MTIKGEHRHNTLRVHTLLPDFLLEDVWRLPVELSDAHSLQLFLNQFTDVLPSFLDRGVTGFLLRVRKLLGGILRWDSKLSYHGLRPGSIRARYAEAEDLIVEDLPDPGSGSFVPVFILENEFLVEIENKTVHAALHLSRVPRRAGVWSVNMAMYVKPKGMLGRLYMQLIKPFRIYIVYPSILREAGRIWMTFLAKEGDSHSDQLVQH